MKSFFMAALSLAATTVFAQETKTENDTIKPKELKEVTITQQKKFIKVDSDKTTVSVKDNAMLSTGNAYDAVKKMPGVIASPTGGLSLNGKGVVIYIDGAPSTLSGSDLENYLSSLPANAIEKAELIYNPGAAFDANASGSIINLVTSTKRLKGINASFNINYNFNKYQKPSPQILLNGKEKNLSWQTMIGYNYIEWEQKSRNGQTFTTFDPDKFINQNRLNVNTNRNFYARVGTNYRLSEKSNLLFNYNTTFANDRGNFDALTSGSEIPDYFNNGTTKTKASNHEISLQYKTKLDTIGRTLDIIAFTNTFNRNPDTKTSAVENNVSSFNNFKNDFELLNYYLKYDFAIPFEKQNFSINTGGKFNTIKVNNLGSYNLNSATTDIIDFDYTETNLAFYAEVRKKIKKLHLTAGLRFENFEVDRIGIVDDVKTNIDFKNNNLFPNVSAMYEVTNDVNVTASYSRKISQPSYSVLDPNGGNFDQYNTSGGNLLLNPSFFDNFEFKISALQFIQLGTNYTVSKDHNLFLMTAEPGELVSTQTFQQFDRFKTFSAYANFPIPLDYFFKGKEEFQKRMNNIDKMNYIFVNINYIKNLTDGYDFSFDSSPVWNYGAQAQIMLPWDVKNTLNYFILPEGGVWEIYKITKPIQQFDISFNKDFMNKKLKLGLHMFDIFNQNEVNALISSTNLQTRFYEKNDSRHFRISLTYNFGNLKLQNENTTIETEKVKSGGGFVK
ncbi:TonB-dependent receptor domain-containing protein [Flavobacterium dankookense]|uniref:Outer membrane receptor protein involved in Fe transport n=1 Tax=Flavobacterium dankookense TaxID=706186 RepID=A0A4R6Q7E2_9FLAO|nr:TonB-dependent receptor [Flavobacterium dankookense]TDP58141.1 outer membrane receptor protein involved in Fe transport [Flavobacterium dankookense]